MKILHIFSNWKWTGPAAHAVNLAATLQQLGHEVTFACAAPPGNAPESLAACARAAGLAPLTRLTLNKHFNLLDNIADVPRLRRFIKKEGFDIVHTHLPNDHFLTGMALRMALSKTPIVRTCYDGEGVRGGPKTRMLFSTMTDALITISERTREQILGRRYISPRKVWKVDIPVDLRKFDPESVSTNRSKYNLADEAVVGGIVARVQRHRRFEVLLEALEMVIREFPNFKFMVIGRGTYIQEIAVKPSQAMGIRTNLIFTGYKNEDFRQTLACLNFKVFLVPGTDGACRAVREAMAMRIPVIAANRGMLPEIMFLIENPDLRCMMAENAYQKARRLFDLEKQSRKVAAIYETVLSRKSARIK